MNYVCSIIHLQRFVNIPGSFLLLLPIFTIIFWRVDLFNPFSHIHRAVRIHRSCLFLQRFALSNRSCRLDANICPCSFLFLDVPLAAIAFRLLGTSGQAVCTGPPDFSLTGMHGRDSKNLRETKCIPEGAVLFEVLERYRIAPCSVCPHIQVSLGRAL